MVSKTPVRVCSFIGWGRNGVSPPQGIDTLLLRPILPISTVVEMELARHRALTHDHHRYQHTATKGRNGVSPPQGIDTSDYGTDSTYHHFGRNGVSPPQGIDTSMQSKNTFLSFPRVEMELARHRALTLLSFILLPSFL